MSDRSTLIALATAGAAAVALPLALLIPGAATDTPPRAAAPMPLAGPTPPPLADVYKRPLFGTVAAEDGASSGDAPALIGIVGRLGEDAVALVRTADGTTRTLRIGESMDGWSLASLAIDAAFFTRGAERVRVPLPAG